MVELKAKSNVRTIKKEQLRERMKTSSNIQVVNVLSADQYNLGSIKGSKKIPLADLDKRIGELDKKKDVVTYCAGTDCSASIHAAEKLTALGFTAMAYEGGISEWKEAGFPTE